MAAPVDGRHASRTPFEVLAVYSLGLSLWHFAGGRLTDLGSTVSEQVAARVATDLPVLAPEAGLPDEARELLRAATRRRPEQRPSAAELADGLAAVFGGA